MVNYYIHQFEEALINHSFGLTEDETFNYEDLIHTSYDYALSCEGPMSLEDEVEEFLVKLVNDELEWGNKEKYLEHDEWDFTL